MKWKEIKLKFLNINEKLQIEFSTRFSDFYNIGLKVTLFENPFIVDIVDVECCLEMEIIELKMTKVLKFHFMMPMT